MTHVARSSVAAVSAAVALLAPSSPAAAGVGEDGGGRQEVRVSGVCGSGAATSLRLRARDGVIRLELRVEYARGAAGWRVALVHERRVVWKGSGRTGRLSSFKLRRTVPDLPGADAFVVRVWGPAGVTCRATATLGA